MTPKEKSQEIVDSMMRTGDPHHTECICFEIAKRCALIAVDEIMHVFRFNLFYGYEKHLTYWKEVRQEIENL